MNKINIFSSFSAPVVLDGKRANLRNIWGMITLRGGYWRLYWNASRGAGVYCGGERVELLPDRLYLISPHCNLKTWCEASVEQIYWHFDFSEIAGNPIHPIFSAALTPEREKQIRELEKFSPTESGALRFFLLSTALITGVLGELPPEALRPPRISPKIQKICKLLRETPEKSYTLSALAIRIGMAPNSFLRKFRVEVGCTPLHYLREWRYSFAERLLRGGNDTLEMICEQVGIRDQFHFAREFKRRYGMSPGQYRKECSRRAVNIPSE